MIFYYNKQGFFTEKRDEYLSPIKIINLILSGAKVELDFKSNLQDCLDFLYNFYYPVILKQFLTVGKFLWVNPVINTEINRVMQADIVEDMKKNLTPSFRAEIKDSIENNGIFFPFLGESEDSIWFGKHRWDILTNFNYNKDFLFIVVKEGSNYSAFFPKVYFIKNKSYRVFFERLPLSLHANFEYHNTHSFVDYSDFMGKNYEHLKQPLDFINNKENFQKFLNNEDQWSWLNQIARKI